MGKSPSGSFWEPCSLASTALPPRRPRTMRVDYFHTGNATEEQFSLDRVVLEPLAWPGNPRRPVDDTNLGKYLFEVVDRATNRTLYSRGFASIYGEWETTGEAKTLYRTFSRVAPLPGPGRRRSRSSSRSAIRGTRSARSGRSCVDPKDMFIDTSKPALARARSSRSSRSGEPAERSTS